MGVLASDDKWSPFDTELPQLPVANSVGNVVFLHNDWKPTARQISQTAIVKYNVKKRQDTANQAVEADKNLRFSPAQILTVALCELCAESPRFSSSSLCSNCIERRAKKERASGHVIELTNRDVMMAYLLAALLVVFFFLSGLSEIKPDPSTDRQIINQSAR